jgi:hypothetical protein
VRRQRAEMYIVISKPKRKSWYCGLDHFIVCLLSMVQKETEQLTCPARKYRKSCADTGCGNDVSWKTPARPLLPAPDCGKVCTPGTSRRSPAPAR